MQLLQHLVRRFWAWYHRHYLLTLVVTTGLFGLQVFHLYWLFTDVVLQRMTGRSFFVFPPAGMFIYVLVDYLEIPALLSTTLLYLYQLRRGLDPRALVYLFLLNTQWIHLLWITDEVVVDTLTSRTLLPWNALVAWVAILIDYLEVPVIIDTLYRVYTERHAIWAEIRAHLLRGVARRPGAAAAREPVTMTAGERGRSASGSRVA
jgi:hypothetical protein